jgi:hypothetical protein
MNSKTYNLEGWINGDPPFFFVVVNIETIEFISLWLTPIERVLLCKALALTIIKDPKT